MKLKQIQQERIEQIIKEEMRNLKEGWVQSDTSKRRSIITEKALFETPQEIDQNLSVDLENVSVDLESAVIDLTDTVLMTYDNEFYAHVLSLLQSRGIVASNMTSDDLMDEVANYDNEMLKAAQMKVSQDLASVLADYARKISFIVTGAFSSPSEDE